MQDVRTPIVCILCELKAVLQRVSGLRVEDDHLVSAIQQMLANTQCQWAQNSMSDVVRPDVFPVSFLVAKNIPQFE